MGEGPTSPAEDFRPGIRGDGTFDHRVTDAVVIDQMSSTMLTTHPRIVEASRTNFDASIPARGDRPGPGRTRKSTAATWMPSPTPAG